MNTVDHFAISYLVPEISTFKKLQHDATTTATKATVKIVILSGFHMFYCESFPGNVLSTKFYLIIA